MLHFSDKSIFLEIRDINWKRSKNVPSYGPKQHLENIRKFKFLHVITDLEWLKSNKYASTKMNLHLEKYFQLNNSWNNFQVIN